MFSVRYSRFVALVYKGKRVYIYGTNLNDIESALLPEEMKKKACVCVYVSREQKVSRPRTLSW